MSKAKQQAKWSMDSKPLARCRVKSYVNEDGRYDRRAIMISAHDSIFNARLRGWEMTMSEALRQSWDFAHMENARRFGPFIVLDGLAGRRLCAEMCDDDRVRRRELAEIDRLEASARAA